MVRFTLVHDKPGRKARLRPFQWPHATGFQDGAIGGIALLQLNPAQLEPIIPDGNGHTAGRLLPRMARF